MRIVTLPALPTGSQEQQSRSLFERLACCVLHVSGRGRHRRASVCADLSTCVPAQADRGAHAGWQAVPQGGLARNVRCTRSIANRYTLPVLLSQMPALLHGVLKRRPSLTFAIFVPPRNRPRIALSFIQASPGHRQLEQEPKWAGNVSWQPHCPAIAPWEREWPREIARHQPPLPSRYTSFVALSLF